MKIWYVYVCNGSPEISKILKENSFPKNGTEDMAFPISTKPKTYVPPETIDITL